jgi:hypothetical protein
MVSSVAMFFQENCVGNGESILSVIQNREKNSLTVFDWLDIKGRFCGRSPTMASRRAQLNAIPAFLRPRSKFKPNLREPYQSWQIVKGDKVEFMLQQLFWNMILIIICSSLFVVFLSFFVV